MRSTEVKAISDLRSQISKRERDLFYSLMPLFVLRDSPAFAQKVLRLGKQFTRGRRGIFLLVLIAVLTSGCASRQAYYPPGTMAPVDLEAPESSFTGVYHMVEEGQTLWRISKTYGVDLETVQWVNDVEDVANLRVGRVLFIPGATRQMTVEPFQPEEEPSAELIDLIWPLKGRATSGYGPRGRRVHEGIDIAAPRGTPVLASAGGKVAYSGNGMRGYGKVIVIKHTNDLSTVYAHNSSLLVRIGDGVEQGQMIAIVGSTGKSSGPHLHFEIRRRGVPEDPRKFL
ncbi:MAG: peptidoglycan DD-metalloendopeptidase family protein, partial [bacterium]